MVDLVLVAASGLAREVLSIAKPRFADIEIVDDDASRWGHVLHEVPVTGGLDRVAQLTDARVLVCAGHGNARRSLVRRLRGLGVAEERYLTLVHPSVEVPETCAVGGGSILLAHAVLTADVTLGRHVVVMPNATFTHDDVIDDYATICAGVSLGGGVRIGEAAYLGMNAVVREGLRVGREATLGMGGVLLESLPESETWAGVPAGALVGHRNRTTARPAEAAS